MSRATRAARADWDPTPPVRPPLGLELTYRSEAALLVAYSTYLVKGQLPIETANPFPSGTTLGIRLLTPSTSISLAGVVAWTRSEAQGPGQPPGMGVLLAASTERIGAAIDELAFAFRGIKALVAASQAAPRAMLIRYLKSIITCEVIEVDQKKLAEPDGLCNVDLTVIDLDSVGARRVRAVRAAAATCRCGLGAGARGGAARARPGAGSVAGLRRGAGQPADVRRHGDRGPAMSRETDLRQGQLTAFRRARS